MREECSKRKYILREDEKEWGYGVTCDLLMWPIKKEIPTSFAQRTNRDLTRRFYSTKGQTLKEISEKKGKRQKKKNGMIKSSETKVKNGKWRLLRTNYLQVIYWFSALAQSNKLLGNEFSRGLHVRGTFFNDYGYELITYRLIIKHHRVSCVL